MTHEYTAKNTVIAILMQAFRKAYPYKPSSVPLSANREPAYCTDKQNQDR